MTDIRDDWDPFGPVKEEPDCPRCYDSGGPCRSCRPTRLQALWYGLTWRVRWLRRRQAASGNTEAPF